MTLIAIPDEFPEILDAKFYKVTNESFGGTGPPHDCAQPKISEVTCCVSGVALNSWIDGGKDCTNQNGLCHVVTASAYRLIGVEGPFDTGACV